MLALVLSAQMIFSLTACGGKKNNESGANPNANTNSGSGNVSAGSGNARIVSESDPYYNVTSSPIQVSISQDKEIMFSDIGYHDVVGDRIVAYVTVSYEMPDEVLNRLLSLDLSDDQQMAEYDRIEDEYEDVSLQLFDLNGELIANIDFDPNGMYLGAYPGKDGEILIVSAAFEPRECRSIPKVSVISSSGEKLRDIDLQIKDGLQDVELYVLENGNMLLTSIGTFWILDGDGKVLSEESNALLNGKVLLSGGKWFAVMPQYTMNGVETYVQEFDTDSGKLVGTPFKSSDVVLWMRQGEQDCFILNANGIEKFDIATQTKTQVLAWKDTDVNSATLDLQGARITSENDMVFFQVDLIDDGGRGSMDLKAIRASSTNIVRLSKADKNPHAGKTLLTLGIDGDISATFLEQVLEYNKDPNNAARIEILDYTADANDSYDEQEVEQKRLESKNQLVMDMLSGNSPDILVSYSEISQFNTDTMLIDLNPLISSDSTFNRDELFDNILHSFEEDGKLYTIPLTYTLEGMVINTSFSGAKENWTFTDFDQMATSLSPNVQPVSSDSPDDLLKQWMKSLSSHFIDNQNETVDFESEEFRALLETVKKYGQSGGADRDYEPVDEYGFPLSNSSLFQENMVACCYTYIPDLQVYASLSRENTGHTVAFTGVPSLTGMGMTAKGQLSMSITASCAAPDIAWQFIRSLLNEDAQHALSFNTDTLPVNRNAYKKNCQIELDVNREFLKDLKENASRVSPDLLNSSIELTQEHIDSFEKLISSVAASQSWDTDILNIILEEAAGFFAGQRSLDDVCSIIQNRATIVVQER